MLAQSLEDNSAQDTISVVTKVWCWQQESFHECENLIIHMTNRLQVEASKKVRGDAFPSVGANSLLQFCRVWLAGMDTAAKLVKPWCCLCVVAIQFVASRLKWKMGMETSGNNWEDVHFLATRQSCEGLLRVAFLDGTWRMRLGQVVPFKEVTLSRQVSSGVSRRKSALSRICVTTDRRGRRPRST